MKAIVVLLAIHLMAYSFAEAQQVNVKDASDSESAGISSGLSGSSSQTAAVTGQLERKLDDCKDILPQMESDYREIESKYRSLNSGSQASQESYLISFNEMTQYLFELTEAREVETQKISMSRDQLRDSLNRFNQNRNPQNSKALQDHYLDLTVRLYSAMMDSQKTLETLKGQISQIESTRSQYANSQKELESLDHQKLALEAKLISLKIKCQPAKRY